MGAVTRELRFYFDFISHNAYLAWTQIHSLAERNRCHVVPVPVLFAGLLDAHGQLGPAEVRAKAGWMIRDVLRKCGELGVTIEPPPFHPFNPLLALRVSSLDMDDGTRLRLVDRLFGAVWRGGASVTDPGAVARCATLAGLDGEAAVAEASTPETKARLRRQTDDAIQRGVFGVPTMIVDDELFWGYDDFRFLDLYLRGEDPLDRTHLEAWRAIRPSAQRPGGRRRRGE